MIRIGTSGWVYPEWRGTYYPADLPQRRQLEYLAGRMSTVEINGSFYSLRRPANYRSWYAQTPPDFQFAVKGNRFVTHIRRLREPTVPLANFLGSGVLELAEKLGPLLWQFPPSLSFDADVLADFLAALPKDTTAAVDLVRQHATMVDDVTQLPRDHRLLRHVVEVRHPTFRSARCYDLLRQHGVALVAADTAGLFPYIEERTADFTYVRLHGATELYVSDYGESELYDWAAKIREWHAYGDVYVYFDNTANAAAPHNAERLAGLLGLVPAS
jgi:uncharacterized protein YecE (DUF72 family)